jgi:monovalent cation:H+ antiporter-2, CPA2 family
MHNRPVKPEPLVKPKRQVQAVREEETVPGE